MASFPTLSTNPSNVKESSFSAIKKFQSENKYTLLRKIGTKTFREWVVTYDRDSFLTAADKVLLETFWRDNMGLFFQWQNPDKEVLSIDPIPPPSGSGTYQILIYNGYAKYGRSGIGTNPWQITTSEYTYWYNLLDTEVVSVTNFNSVFDAASLDYIFDPLNVNDQVAIYCRDYIQGGVYSVFFNMDALEFTPLYTTSTYYTVELVLAEV